MKKMILCCLVAVLGCGVFAVEAKTPQKKGEIVTTVFTIDRGSRIFRSMFPRKRRP